MKHANSHSLYPRIGYAYSRRSMPGARHFGQLRIAMAKSAITAAHYQRRGLDSCGMRRGASR